MGSSVGFAGLGAMGGGMARRLLAAGVPLHVYDPLPEARAALEAVGATAATEITALADRCDVVHTSLPSPEVFARVYESDLLPRARSGQVFVDHTTAHVGDVRRIAERLAQRGAALLDAPVSGGSGGATSGRLRIFVGGSRAAMDRVVTHFDAMGDNVAYCGPSGAGQIVKIVNQLGMGLSAAVLLEALALGVRGGVEPKVLAKAVGSDSGCEEPWRRQLYKLAETVAAEKGQWVSVKEAQLDDFLADARELGQAMPMAAAVAEACRGQEKIVREANRMAASYWRALGMEDASPVRAKPAAGAEA